MGIGALATIVGLVKILGTLNRNWVDEYIELNDRKPQRTPLEPVLVISAILALAAFGLGILVRSGGGDPPPRRSSGERYSTTIPGPSVAISRMLPSGSRK